MGTHITTISISPEQAAYVLNKNLKLSHITQVAIENMMKADGAGTELKNLIAKYNLAMKEIDKQYDFILKKGLMNEFEVYNEGAITL